MDKLILKTGFDNLDQSQEITPEFKMQITALITVFMENSLKSAAKYTKHAGRTMITASDVSLALKKELFTFLDNDDIEDRAMKIYEEFQKEIDEEYDESDEEYDESDEEYDESDDEEEYDASTQSDKNISKNNLEDEDYAKIAEDFTLGNATDEIYNDEEPFTISKCPCEFCVQMNNYQELWKTWKPTNNIEEVLYNAIQEVDKKI